MKIINIVRILSIILLLVQVINLNFVPYISFLRKYVPEAYATTGWESERLLTLGFERNSTTANHEYTSNVNSPAISTGTVRSGTYSMNTALGASSTEGFVYDWATADTGTAGMVIRAYIRIATLPGATSNILEVSDGTNAQASLRLDSSGTLSLWNDEDSTQVGSDYGTDLSTNTWYRIELRYDFGTAATGDTTIEARLDGTEFASSTTENHANGVRRVRFGILTSTTADFFWDDIAINQEAFAGQEAWPGEGKVVMLVPNGNGTSTGWAGGTGSNDYQEADDTPAAGFDDATSYVQATATTHVEDFTYPDASTVGIALGDTIRVVEGWARGAGSTTGAFNFAVSLSGDGTNFESGGNISINSTSYVTNDDAVPLNASATTYDQPGSTLPLAWTTTMVDALQTRLTSSDVTPNPRVTAVWVIIEYVPAEGGRIFSSGFELQSVTTGVEWSTIASTPAISTSTYRSGAASANITSLSSGTGKAVANQFKASNTNGPFWFRTYFRVATAPSAANRFITLSNTSNGTIVYITIDNSRILRLNDEDGQIGSASSALSADTWYRIEIKFDASGAGANDVVEARIDGTEFAASSTRDLSTGIAILGLGGNLGAEAQTTGSWFFDDVAINQDAGSIQGDYPGAGSIVHMQVDSDGSDTAWTASGCTNDYECVDEVTPDDATTILTSTTLDQLESLNLESASNAGISSGDTITLVSAGVRMSNSGTSTQSLSVRLKDSTANYIESAHIIGPNTTWFTNASAVPRDYPITAYTRPLTSTSWTASALDSAQVGMRVNVDSTNNLRVSTIWLLVEYVPSTSYTLSNYRFYVDSNNENVTDPWGATDLAENTAISVLPYANNAPISTDEVRIRVGITIGAVDLSSSSAQFKLQYKAGTDASCTTGSWTDVGAGGGGSIWRYATSSVTDGTTLTSLKLAASDVLGVYAKSAPTTANPSSVSVGQDIEYDFHIEHNGAADATTYSFKVVKSDGTELGTYTNCPTLTTRPTTSNLMRHGAFFASESEGGFLWAD